MLADRVPGPPTVLVVSETAGFHHDSIPAQQRFLRSLRGLRVVVVDRVAQLTAARLRAARAVVFASTSGEPRLSATGRRALLRFVRGGGGFVGTHAASDTFARWPAFVRLVGTRVDHHGPIERRRLVVADRRHSVTRGLPASFVATDEYYRFASDPRRGGAHVLLTLGVPGRPPLAWVRREGSGRVFYSALGHPIAAWSDPHVRRLVSQGVRWVLRLP
jgi:type 1 glutamine amidotransferase